MIRRFAAWGEQWCLASWWEPAANGWEPAMMRDSSAELLRVAALTNGGRAALRAHRQVHEDEELVACVALDLESGLLALHRRSDERATPRSELSLTLAQTTDPLASRDELAEGAEGSTLRELTPI